MSSIIHFTALLVLLLLVCHSEGFHESASESAHVVTLRPDGSLVPTTSEGCDCEVPALDAPKQESDRLPSPPHSPFARIGYAAPEFTMEGVAPNGEFQSYSLEEFRGRYVVLVAYPLDWTFVCPTELLAFSDMAAEFETENAVLLAYSVDSVYSHLAWIRTARKEGGLGGSLNLPLLSDLNKQVSQRYGALLSDSGHTMRALYIIDERGTLRHMTLQDAPVGRSAAEVLRLVKAFRFSDHSNEVCPAGWNKPGDATIVPDPEKARAYFETVNA
mmetsp:Transcript_25022/g.62835  ORF Transcript_25022/g.62835 Transcript_25022/m.62835 type:complete len:273 (-) Transcript_25022:1484-2302(-)